MKICTFIMKFQLMTGKYISQHFYPTAIIATIWIVVFFESCHQSNKTPTSDQTSKPSKISASELPFYSEEFVMFPGGNEAFAKFLQENIVYKKGSANGKVYASFTINKIGALTDIKIIKGLNPMIDKEVIRVLKLSPKWQPEKINGKPGETRLTIPINFSQL